MRWAVGERTVNASTGAVDIDGDGAVVVLVHGAGNDRTAWQLQTRWLAHRGLRAVAVDLPAHGSTDGPPLASIGDMADWLLEWLDVAELAPVHLVGHSMGSLVALEAASRRPESVRSLVLLGTAEAMPVHPELISSAENGDVHGPELMTAWGLGLDAHVGGHPAPGMWMVGSGQALLERSLGDVLASDLKACAAYEGAPAAAAAVDVPITIVAGGADRMTPARSGHSLAEASGATVVDLPGIGHSMMVEAAGPVRQAIVEAVERASG
jgi:pimeloyl-ACP methyl ester carboxylesterase